MKLEHFHSFTSESAALGSKHQYMKDILAQTLTDISSETFSDMLSFDSPVKLTTYPQLTFLYSIDFFLYHHL